MILNYNGERFLEGCMAAVLAQELEGGFEVLVVDNASRDGSVDLLRRRFPQVRLIQSPRNLGFAAGNNLGISEASGRHVVLLNNDTEVKPGWLKALVATAEGEPRCGAVAGKLLFKDRPATVQNAGSLLLTDGSGADRGSGEDEGAYRKREEVFAACGASVLLTRPMLADVGGLDSTFFMYYEDTDLSWRMRLRGWRIIFEPEAQVLHVHAATSVEWSPFFTFHVDRNRLFMILKNAPAGFVARSFLSFAALSARNAARTLIGRFRRPPSGLEKANLGPGRARIHARVVASLLGHAPEMLVKRIRIRARRTVPDTEIERFMYPREAWNARFR